jgi:16S rRNA (guanine966-N2)-methyltransferase
MPSLRITAGTLRGRRVPLPRHEVRPTSERARQAFFDIVGDRIDGARFLDLFAGTGIFSFEAASRGAAGAVAIDISSRSTQAIAKLAATWDVPVEALTADAVAGIKRLRERVFDVVYADPPYDYPHYDTLLETVDRELGLAPSAIVAVEHKRRTQPFAYQPSHLRFRRRAEYGEVWIALFERESE